MCTYVSPNEFEISKENVRIPTLIYYHGDMIFFSIFNTNPLVRLGHGKNLIFDFRLERTEAYKKANRSIRIFSVNFIESYINRKSTMRLIF